MSLAQNAAPGQETTSLVRVRFEVTKHNTVTIHIILKYETETHLGTKTEI